MLSARIPREKTATAKRPKPPVPDKSVPSVLGLQEPFVPLSQSSVFLYRGKDLISSRFMDKATSDYGISFQQAKPGDPLAPSDPTALELYKRAPGNLVFSITTFTDLRTAWLHNLFTRSSQKLPFTLRSGATVESDQMVSSVWYFRHVRNEEFEAVELPCGEAYLLVVLPAPGKDLVEIEKRIAAEEFKLEPMLQSEQGDVTFPIFRIHFREDLQPPLKSLGLKKVFSDPVSLRAMVNTLDGAFLTTTQQQVDLDVDDWGIKARAVTFMGGVLGGVVGGSTGPPPRLFHMIVNRPFLFFIRDNATNVLLFLGAEMNPMER
jgi:serine protease inhibitor